MGDLSEHFNEAEFRCHGLGHDCGKVHVDPRLITLLERARSIWGRPISIASGFRCAAHNAAVGGKPTSAHLTGEAADIVCAFSQDRFDLLRTFIALGAVRFGLGKNFLHVDVSQTLPQRVAWLYGEGEA